MRTFSFAVKLLASSFIALECFPTLGQACLTECCGDREQSSVCEDECYNAYCDEEGYGAACNNAYQCEDEYIKGCYGEENNYAQGSSSNDEAYFDEKTVCTTVTEKSGGHCCSDENYVVDCNSKNAELEAWDKCDAGYNSDEEFGQCSNEGVYSDCSLCAEECCYENDNCGSRGRCC